MKMLYVAGLHPLQNADDMLMWEHLNIDVVDTGHYRDSEKPGDLPFIKRRCHDLYDELELQQKGLCYEDSDKGYPGLKNKTWTGGYGHNLWRFTSDFVSKFDVIFFNHLVENIENNWGVLHGKKVIIKTFGMHGLEREKKLKELKKTLDIHIIRNNGVEEASFGNDYAGHDDMIRGSVVRDEHEISGWNGGNREVCTFSSFFGILEDGLCITRGNHYNKIREQLHRLGYGTHLHGVYNERFDKNSTFVSHERKLELLRDCRVNLIVGTPNASNTYSFVESLVMGQPIVAFGPKLWNSRNYEISTIIDNGVNGFYSDNFSVLVEQCKRLMEDESLARRIGEAGRKKGIELFGRDNLSKQWRSLFEKLGVI